MTDKPTPGSAACCDLHNRNCEPPSELCCGDCTEAHHGMHADPPNYDRTLGSHHDGSVCVAPDLSRDERLDALGWWAISGRSLLDMLRRAHSGEDPDLIYAEEYANGDHEEVPGA